MNWQGSGRKRSRPEGTENLSQDGSCPGNWVPSKYESEAYRANFLLIIHLCHADSCMEMKVGFHLHKYIYTYFFFSKLKTAQVGLLPTAKRHIVVKRKIPEEYYLLGCNII
jgi:hypothetical protein